MLSYAKIYTDFLDVAEALSNDDLADLMRAVLAYTATGEVREMSGTAKIVFMMLKKQIDRDKAEYERSVENGKKGGRPAKNPNKPEETQKNPDETQKNPEKPSVTQNNQEQEQDEEQERVTPVTPVRERFNNHWIHSRVARAATAQTICDICDCEGLACADMSILHEECTEAMERGVPPEDILRLARESPSWAMFASRLAFMGRSEKACSG